MTMLSRTLSLFDFRLILMLLLVFVIWKMASKFNARKRFVAMFELIPCTPGVRSFPFIGLLATYIYFMLTVPYGIPTIAYLLHYQYGLNYLHKDSKLVKIDVGWFKQVVLGTSSEVAQAVLSNPDEQKKSHEYEFFKDFIGTGLITAPYLKWKNHRRTLSPAFNIRVVDSFQPTMYQYSNILVEKIKAKIGKETICIEEIMAQCSLGIITETIMGVNLERNVEEGVSFVSSVRCVLEMMTRRIVSPWLWPNLIFQLSPFGRKLKRNMKIVDSFVREIVMKRKEEILKNPDAALIQISKCRPFLELLLLHNLTCKPEDTLSDQDIQEETLTFTFAGFDTVSVTTCWTIYLMGLHPEVRKKSLHEIQTIMNSDIDQPITLDHIKRMDYLDRVIKESQRLYPAVPFLMRILRHDMKLGNVTLPKGSNLSVDIHGLHLDPTVFPDPVLFNPDRFLDANIGTYEFVPFSAGPRNCIGQRFALLELKTVLANIIRNLDWTSLEHRDAILPNPDLVTRPHKPLKIKFKERF